MDSWKSSAESVRTPIEGTIDVEVVWVQSKGCSSHDFVMRMRVIVQRLEESRVIVGGGYGDLHGEKKKLDLIVMSSLLVGVSPSEMIFLTRCTETFCGDGRLHS